MLVCTAMRAILTAISEGIFQPVGQLAKMWRKREPFTAWARLTLRTRSSGCEMLAVAA
ncbi:MAG: hypothetical protein A4E67_00571 [Syntrophaceae bacterium PtaB.Bin038]|nr:MAG: hypothetical protein A4E67_00571 [Syntrophaceae bacterium PtaB.Bin038]